MNISKMYISDLSSSTRFIRDNLEKVVRLLKILEFINKDDYLKGKLVLKGGTAINLTIFNLPRLSVDIDLDFAYNLSKEEIVKERQLLNKYLEDYLTGEGYFITDETRNHYALLSLHCAYINNAGNRDNIKIEINFLDRCHILQPVIRKIIVFSQEINVLTLNSIELYASKINALISRATVRDLYDVYMMIDNNIILDKEMLKKCLIFYNLVGGNQKIDRLDYKNIDVINFNIFKRQLKPLLKKDDNFDIDIAKEKVIYYLNELLVFEKGEFEFIRNFKLGYYKPELLFNKEFCDNILNHPMALWRCDKK